MINRDVKLTMIDELYNRGEWIRQVNDVEYRTRCPYCGDSEKNLYTGHLYIRIDPDDNFPMVWNCFKCNESGLVNQSFLTMMEIDNVDLKSAVTTLNKSADKFKAVQFYEGIKLIKTDFTIPEDYDKKKLKYIEGRLGLKITDDMIKDMKIVFSLKNFLLHNKIDKVTMYPEICMAIEDHYVGFLSYGGSYILFRDTTEKEKNPWIKYPITKECRQSKCFYTMESEIDLFTKDTITVNLSEGIMDILSAYGNLGYDEENTLNIAVGGKRYDTIISYLIDLGILGTNVRINIFADNDESYNEKNKNPTTVEYFKKVFKYYKHLFGEVNVYYNLLKKDIGVPRDEISLKKKKI